MKKILNLLSSLVFVVAGTTSVIACGNEMSPNQAHDNGKEIIKKIKDTSLEYDSNKVVDTSDRMTIFDLKEKLHAVNSQLNPFDLGHVFFSKAQINVGQTANVQLTAKSGGVEGTTTLTIIVNDQAQAIIDKIKDKNINLPSGTDPDTSQSVTIEKIKTALQQANNKLNSHDLGALTFSDVTLNTSTSINVDVIATVESKTAKTTLAVKIINAAQAIIDKIKDKNINLLPGTDPNTTVALTITALLNTVQTANPSLTSDDKATLSFAAVTLSVNQAIAVKVTSTSNSSSSFTDLQVTLLSASGTIVNKITQKNINVVYDTIVSTTDLNTINRIKIALQNANPSLTSDDLTKITFAGTTLVSNTAVDVVTDITATPSDVAHVTLKVTLSKYQAQDIINKITSTSITVAIGTDPDTSNQNTITALRNALKINNSTLTADDIAKLTFSQATLIPDKAVAVELTATLDGISVKKAISVSLNISAQNIIDKIKNKNITVAIGTDPDTSSSVTITVLKTVLQTTNPELNHFDLTKITFATESLDPGIAKTVAVTATINGIPASTNLQVTLTISPAQILAKITKINITLPNTANVSTVNPVTTKLIKHHLQAQNLSLTNSDLAKLSFSSDTLTSFFQNITVTATIGIVTDTKTIKIVRESTATEIFNNFNTTVLTLGDGLNPSTLSSATVTALRYEIEQQNSNISEIDSRHISFDIVNLVYGSSATFNAHIIIGNVTKTVSIQVTLGNRFRDYKSTDSDVPINFNDTSSFSVSGDRSTIGFGTYSQGGLMIGTRQRDGDYDFQVYWSSPTGIQFNDISQIKFNTDGSKVIVFSPVVSSDSRLVEGTRQSDGTYQFTQTRLSGTGNQIKVNKVFVNKTFSTVYLATKDGLTIMNKQPDGSYTFTKRYSTTSSPAITFNNIYAVNVSSDGNKLFLGSGATGIDIGLRSNAQSPYTFTNYTNTSSGTQKINMTDVNGLASFDNGDKILVSGWYSSAQAPGGAASGIFDSANNNYDFINYNTDSALARRRISSNRVGNVSITTSGRNVFLYTDDGIDFGNVIKDGSYTFQRQVFGTAGTKSYASFVFDDGIAYWTFKNNATDLILRIGSVF